jgi:hypothetical protein
MGGRARSIIHVHHRGDRGVDGIMRLIELASHDGPLEAMLTAMCDEIASITGVEIASVYVAEDDRLVMRGNHGFAETAIGAVSLAVGEGITGLVAECMRPVSAAHAAAEAAYKEVPGLGEERFPVFAGIPLISAGAVVGVLVMQRRKKPFAMDEVTLAAALAAPITLAIERRKASAVRSARLTGTGHGGSVVLGRAGVVPTATAIGAAPFAISELARANRATATPDADRSRHAAAPDADRSRHGAAPDADDDDPKSAHGAIASLIDRVLARLRDDYRPLFRIDDRTAGLHGSRCGDSRASGRDRRAVCAGRAHCGSENLRETWCRVDRRSRGRRHHHCGDRAWSCSDRDERSRDANRTRDRIGCEASRDQRRRRLVWMGARRGFAGRRRRERNRARASRSDGDRATPA